jgi:hypothetical protein
MSTILLRDILISARQEAVQMGHYYLGVEHLFIALLQIQGGLASSILEVYGLSADYVIDTLRRKTDRGVTQILWVGIPYTPRTDIVLDIANEMALENGGKEASERDLLCAILQEGDSLPTRVLQTLNVDVANFSGVARTHTLVKEPQPPDILIIFGETFDHADTIQREHLFILRRMFSSYSRIRIERRLTGFSSALILVVTPIRADNREDSSVVVKIDQTDNILDEVQRYETHVKHSLPLRTARLEDIPTAPDSSQLAGVKYTLVANDDGLPQDLRNLVQEHGADGVGRLIQRGLYSQFNKTWWQQRRPFRFQVWKEYDWLLPPILTLEFVSEKNLSENVHLLKIPFNRAKLKSKLQELQFGDVVVLENFIVQRIDRENNVLKLAIGYGGEADKRAYKIEVKGMNLSKSTYYRGQMIERIVGTVWKTRHDLFVDAARALEPDFDIRGQWIPVGDQQLPNPLLAYEDLLDRHVNGSMSKVHGDLHLGNILVGPNNTTWLIDFAHTRDGHALFDWASLEVSLLGDAVMPATGEDWNAVRDILHYLAALDAPTDAPSVSAEVFSGIASVAAIREIARDCLTTRDNWYEYHIALTLCALRAITWTTMPLGSRRLLFLLAALSMRELTRKPINASSLDTPAVDEADRTDHLPDVVPPENPDDLLDQPDQIDDNRLPLAPQSLLQHLAVTKRLDEGVLPSNELSLDDLPEETAAMPSENELNPNSDTG